MLAMRTVTYCTEIKGTPGKTPVRRFRVPCSACQHRLRNLTNVLVTQGNACLPFGGFGSGLVPSILWPWCFLRRLF